MVVDGISMSSNSNSDGEKAPVNTQRALSIKEEGEYDYQGYMSHRRFDTATDFRNHEDGFFGAIIASPDRNHHLEHPKRAHSPF
jgi:hypothetical protein